MKSLHLKIASLGLAITFGTQFVTAEIPANKIPLSWDDACRIARSKNPELQSAANFLESFKANYKSSYNTLFPSINLSNSYSKTDSDTSTTQRWQAKGTASIDVFNKKKSNASNSREPFT